MITFVLTVLNRPDMLARFFERMPIQSVQHEWIIVDNASDDQTKQLEYWLQTTLSNVTILENDRNEGFGPANNQGVQYAKYETVVLTQPDVEFRADITPYLTTLYDGILYGHQLLTWDTGWNRFGNTIVPYLTGYFLAFTKNTWSCLGGFDPIYYPADFEDVDLSYTAVQRGVTLRAVDVPISHAHFGSTWAQFSNREQTTKKNQRLFAEKWGLL